MHPPSVRRRVERVIIPESNCLCFTVARRCRNNTWFCTKRGGEGNKKRVLELVKGENALELELI